MNFTKFAPMSMAVICLWTVNSSLRRHQKRITPIIDWSQLSTLKRRYVSCQNSAGNCARIGQPVFNIFYSITRNGRRNTVIADLFCDLCSAFFIPCLYRLRISNHEIRDINTQSSSQVSFSAPLTNFKNRTLNQFHDFITNLHSLLQTQIHIWTGFLQ